MRSRDKRGGIDKKSGKRTAWTRRIILVVISPQGLIALALVGEQTLPSAAGVALFLQRAVRFRLRRDLTLSEADVLLKEFSRSGFD
jgi:hypothetical protein